MSPGEAQREHSDYQTNGAGCVGLAFAPLTGVRSGEGRDRRTAGDDAAFRPTLLTRHYPQAQTLRLVPDNLNPHPPGACYEVVPPAEAVALGFPDARLGEGIALVVRPDRRGEEEALRAFLKRQLPNFMQPGPILWREDLPRSPNGKLDRVALKAELTA